MTTKKHYADAAYQADRRKKIKTGEIVPNAKPKRMGLVDTLVSGSAWLEECSTREAGNAFMRSVSAIASKKGILVSSKTYVAIDPGTDEAVFIIKSQQISIKEKK